MKTSRKRFYLATAIAFPLLMIMSQLIEKKNESIPITVKPADYKSADLKAAHHD